MGIAVAAARAAAVEVTVLVAATGRRAVVEALARGGGLLRIEAVVRPPRGEQEVPRRGGPLGRSVAPDLRQGLAAPGAGGISHS